MRTWQPSTPYGRAEPALPTRRRGRPITHRRRFAVGAIVCLLTVFSRPALAAELPAFLDRNNVHPVLEAPLNRIESRSEYITTVLARLNQYDQDKNGLDAEDVEMIVLPQEALKRAERFQSILVHDHDGDGRVTYAEVERTFRRQLALPANGPLTPMQLRLLLPKIGAVMESDLNGDRVITHQEMLRGPLWVYPNHRDIQGNLARSLLELDPDKDGRLTADELTSLAEETFRYYDTNGNGSLEYDEKRSIEQRTKISRGLPRQPCDFPRPAADDQVVMLGISGGMATSTTSVTAMAATTTTGKIVVQPGDLPIYLIASSANPMIWQFEGRPDRISRAFIFSRFVRNAPGVGVTGLDRAKVTFVQPYACFVAYRGISSAEAQFARTVIEAAIRRPVDTFLTIDRLDSVELPSGAVPDQTAAHSTGRRTASVIDIDPADVAAPGLIYRAEKSH